jgi:hypothetical protein
MTRQARAMGPTVAAGVAVVLALVVTSAPVAPGGATEPAMPARLGAMPAAPVEWDHVVSGDPVGYDEDADVVVLQDGSGTGPVLRGLAGATGDLLWRAGVPEISFPSVLAPSGAGVLVLSGSEEIPLNGAEGRDGVVVVRAADGRRLWSVSWPVADPEWSVDIAVAGGHVALPTPAGLQARGLVDGADGWSWRAPAGCRPTGVSGHGRLLAVAVGCGPERGTVTLLGADTGRVLWTRDSQDAEVGAVVHDGLVAVDGTRTCTVLDERNRVLLTRVMWSCSNAECLGRFGDLAVVCLRQYEGRSELTAVRMDTGGVSWKLGLDPNRVELRDGRVIVWGGNSPPWPDLLYAIEPRTGEITGVELLAGLRSVLVTPRGLVATSVDDGGATHVRLQQPHLRHNALTDPAWPDPCRLVDDAALRDAFPGATFTRRPGPGQPQWPGTRTRCLFLTAATTGPLVMVDVLWAGPSDAAGRLVMATVRAPEVTSTVTGLAEEAVHRHVDAEPDEIVLRSGGVVVRVVVRAEDPPLRRVADAVAAALAAGPAGKGSR